MKFLFASLAALAVASAALLPGAPLPDPRYGHHNPEALARTVSDVRDIHPDGSYHYSYGTDNGIQAEESGVGGIQATGRASWTSPEGIPVEISYTADENGYQATGTHVPATPEHVIRALEYIRSHPAYDDGYQRPYAQTVQRPVAPVYRGNAFRTNTFAVTPRPFGAFH